MSDPARAEALRSQIADLVRGYHDAAFGGSTFEPGVSPVPCSGRVFDADELVSLMHATLDFWLTEGRFADAFEQDFAGYFGVRHAELTNSGSSANLLAISALTSPRLGERRLRPGDEVITTAAGFPTTVNPILQNGLVPVFVDVELPTFGVDVAQLDAARSERTRAVILAHTLGNPFDLDAVTRFARRHDLWLVEDCCDAVGSTYDGRLVGTFGELATVSFYPAHHITMGEGGCVLTDGPVLHRIVESFRDWGRDCWCEPGDADTCGKRFGWQLGELPCGYDHKYTYSHVGYNLKATDLQAAVGVAQLRKLPDFVASRRANYARLRERVSDLDEHFVLPEATGRSDPSWFGFPMAVRPESPFTRADVVKHLEASRIGTRPLFAGNLTRQPAYADATFRVVSDLAVSDLVMEHAFWVGVYPGLTPSAIDYIAETLHTAVGIS